MSNANEHPDLPHVFALSPSQLKTAMEDMGEPSYRGEQIIRWVYERGAASFDEMTNLSKLLREKLPSKLDLYRSTVLRRGVSADGTVKLLLQWPDGATSESVMIPTDRQKTACLSSQVGCPVGCRFCASGMSGLQRNLTAGEILEQVVRVAAEATKAGGRLSNVVFMGIGEPLANYDAVLAAIRTINAPWGLDIGARKITVSTVGLPESIRRLAGEGLQLNLALSLHAPTDGLRRDLIPWAKEISLARLRAACKHYFDKTGREITLEYTLLDMTNDRPEHAEALAKFANSLRCNVNLLRYNPVEALPFDRPTSETVQAFQKMLRNRGVNSHIRKSRGLDIDAACGQLRRRVLDAPDLDDEAAVLTDAPDTPVP